MAGKLFAYCIAEALMGNLPGSLNLVLELRF